MSAGLGCRGLVPTVAVEGVPALVLTRTASLRPTPPSTSPTPRWSANSPDATTTAWLAGGNFTLADCAAAPALHYADVVHQLDRNAHRALAAYFDRALARSSVTRVVEEARPYRELFPLPWPERVS